MTRHELWCILKHSMTGTHYAYIVPAKHFRYRSFDPVVIEVEFDEFKQPFYNWTDRYGETTRIYENSLTNGKFLPITY